MVVEAKILKCDIPFFPVPNLPFPDFILQLVKSFAPDKAAEVWLHDWSTKKEIRFCEIAPLVARLNVGMQKRGFQPGTVICMYTSNHVEVPLIHMAAWQLKGITSTVSSKLPNAVAARCNTCQARIICCDRKRAANALLAKAMCTTVEEIWVIDGEFEGCVSLTQLQCDTPEAQTETVYTDREHNPDDVLWVPFSSGTTGLPKGIMHTHKTLLSMITMGSSHVYPWGPLKGAHLFMSEMTYMVGLVSAFHGMATARQSITFSEYSDISLVKAIADIKPHTVRANAPQLSWLVRNPESQLYDLSSVEGFFIGGSTWNTDDEAAIFSIFPHLKYFHTSYGMTEVGCISSTHLRKSTSEKAIQEKRSTSGWLFPGVSLKVLDAVTGEVVGAGQEGMIWVQTPTLMKGYWCNPQASENFFKDGWAFTGDLGYYDEDERVFITGRIEDLITYRTIEVFPMKIENTLCSLEGIADACVVGIAHEIDGHHPAAAVVLQSGAKLSVDDIKDYVNRQVTDGESLRGGVYFLERIPYNENGKALKRQVLLEIASQNK